MFRVCLAVLTRGVRDEFICHTTNFSGYHYYLCFMDEINEAGEVAQLESGRSLVV